jgi:uncharacterized protein (TIGR03382 family)
VSDSPDADLGNPDPGAEDGEDGGCGCQSNGSGTSGLASLLLLAGLCLSMRRRRWLR